MSCVVYSLVAGFLYILSFSGFYVIILLYYRENDIEVCYDINLLNSLFIDGGVNAIRWT